MQLIEIMQSKEDELVFEGEQKDELASLIMQFNFGEEMRQKLSKCSRIRLVRSNRLLGADARLAGFDWYYE